MGAKKSSVEFQFDDRFEISQKRYLLNWYFSKSEYFDEATKRLNIINNVPKWKYDDQAYIWIRQ